MIGRDAASVVGYFNDRRRALALHGHRDCSIVIDRLQSVKQEIQQHLVDLIAVMLHFWERRFLVQRDLDRLSQRLLATQHDSMFDRGIQVAFAYFRGMWPGRLQKVGNDVVDASDLLADVFHYGASGAGSG